jgi:hypothetical protein
MQEQKLYILEKQKEDQGEGRAQQVLQILQKAYDSQRT